MRLTIAKKVFSIAFLVLCLMAVVSIYSIKVTSNITEELETLTNQHMPLAESVSQINLHILEQGLLLQQLLVLNNENSPLYYQKLGNAINNEFDKINRFAPSQNISRRLATLRRNYNDFNAHALLLLKSHKLDDSATFNTLLPQLNKHQNAIDREISNFRDELENDVKQSVLWTQREENKLLNANVILNILAILLSLLLTISITRMMVQSIQNLVEGTKALEEGDLDVEVNITSNDEIANLTTSFNDMVGKLRIKERIKDTFGKYMDPRIVSKLIQGDGQFNVGGQRHEMSVMFIDLKGFTSISEVLAPDDLIFLINKFFGHMTNAISENNGVVDKFMGDCVMAYWGEPFCNKNEHAQLACSTAHLALKYLNLFRQDVQKELGDNEFDLDIDIRIGISTGDMVVGPIGSNASKSYTVMGDAVNLGSRLETANKAYGTHVIISGRTAELIGDLFLTRELDLIRVKGKSESTKIFELMSLKDFSIDEAKSVSKQFIAGLMAYRAQDWERAELIFLQCLIDSPNDPPSAVYLKRLEKLRHSSLSPDWDGIWNFEN